MAFVSGVRPGCVVVVSCPCLFSVRSRILFYSQVIGVHEIVEFSTCRPDWANSNHILEILIDGESFYQDRSAQKTGFCFGIQKARLLLACVSEIKRFRETDGRWPKDEVIEIESEEWGVNCTLQKTSEFQNSFGKRIEKPYLEIVDKSSEKKNTEINFGLQKARGVIEVESDIIEFVDKYLR